jgi:hypothetical protein
MIRPMIESRHRSNRRVAIGQSGASDSRVDLVLTGVRRIPKDRSR